MKPTDAQLVILNTACKRDDRVALPLPASLKGGAAQKVVASLIAKGLVEEVDAWRGEPYWRKTDDGHGVTLAATDAAFEALGIDLAIAEQAPTPPPKPTRAISSRRRAMTPMPIMPRPLWPTSRRHAPASSRQS